MRICVVGCGAAGLAVLRVLSEEIESHIFNGDFFGFERADNIGGIWNYDLNIDKVFTSPMYQHLRTNLPKEVMSYPDFLFTNQSGLSFINHSEVIDYIKEYAKKFDLEKYIEFNSNITNVEPFIANGTTKWKVSITNSTTNFTETRLFDVVVLSNGHFDQPFIPEIKGIAFFKGDYIHSKYYRVPENYKDKKVLVLGAKNSGTDIAIQLTHCAKKVFLSHNMARLKSRIFRESIQEIYGISEIDSNGFVCTTDGNKFEVDSIIFCTGYKIGLDFLSESCKVQWDNSNIRPLYKSMISPYYPTSLFFIGVGYEITPFTFFFMQSKVIRAILQNCAKNISLSTEDMLEEIEMETKALDDASVQLKHRHIFNKKQWPYYRWCELVAGDLMTAKVPRHLEYMFEIVKKWRYEHIDLYREINLELCDDNALGFIIKNGPDNDFFTEDFENLLRLLRDLSL